jgi:hypothetical protein
MTLKELLQNQINQKRLSSLADLIYASRNAHYLKITMHQDTDVVHKWLCFGYKLLEPGQQVWDKLVSLGFQPKFSWGGEWAGGPGIIVRW